MCFKYLKQYAPFESKCQHRVAFDRNRKTGLNSIVCMNYSRFHDAEFMLSIYSFVVCLPFEFIRKNKNSFPIWLRSFEQPVLTTDSDVCLNISLGYRLSIASMVFVSLIPFATQMKCKAAVVQNKCCGLYRVYRTNKTVANSFPDGCIKSQFVIEWGHVFDPHLKQVSISKFYELVCFDNRSHSLSLSLSENSEN